MEMIMEFANNHPIVGMMIPMLVTVCSLLSMFFPSVGKSDWYNKIMSAVNLLALNWMKARNADEGKK